LNPPLYKLSITCSV